MQYKKLGRAGVLVSELCLGTMNFGDPTDEKTSVQILNMALDAGINFIDTANIYADGVSEEMLGRALKGKRDHVVLATKVFGWVDQLPNGYGSSRYHIMREVENSLRRLQTDHIDLYQLHRPHPGTPIDETMRAMDDLVRQGKVRYTGTSVFAGWQLVEALWTADHYNLERPVSEQPPYSIFARGIEKEVLPVCEKYGFAVLPWSPLAGGWLSGKYRKGKPIPAGSRLARKKKDMDVNSPDNVRRFDAVEALVPLAEELGLTLAEFALAWVKSNPLVTAPLLGPRTIEHLQSYLKVLDTELPAEIIKKVDAIVPSGTDLFIL